MPHHHLITNSPFQYEHISNAKSHSLTFNIHRSKTNQGHSGSPRSWSLLSPVLKIGVGRSGRSQGSPGQDHVRGRGATTTLAKLFNLIYQYTWGGSYPLLPPQGEGGGELFLVCGKYYTACLQLGYELHVPWGKCGQVLASLEREKGGELNCAGMEVEDIQFNMMSRFFFNRQWRIWQWRRVTNIGQQIYRFSDIPSHRFSVIQDII